VSFDGTAFNFTGTAVAAAAPAVKITGYHHPKASPCRSTFDYCYTGLPGVATRKLAIESVRGRPGGLGGGSEPEYTYSASCAPGALDGDLQ
jgi:hypothetical protein